MVREIDLHSIVMQLRGVASVLGLAYLVTQLSACGPNPYDAYIEAMRAQGAAERGSCKLRFNAARRTHVVNSGQITRCIRDMNDVLDLYEKAKGAGYQGKDLERAVLKIREDIRKLSAMKATVSDMEAVP